MMHWLGCIEFWFNRYQTLLAALIALTAAWVAVRPVWKQLHLSAIQTKVTLRDAISSRENLIATRAEKSRRRLNEFWDEFQRGYASVEDNGRALSHWILDQESRVDAQIAFLEKEQAENIDGDETTISRTRLTGALLELASCISNVNATVHLDYMADERPIEDAELKKAEQQETEAAVKLPDCIGSVENAIVKLQASFERDFGELRLKRQLLDQMLAASEVD